MSILISVHLINGFGRAVVSRIFSAIRGREVQTARRGTFASATARARYVEAIIKSLTCRQTSITVESERRIVCAGPKVKTTERNG